MPWRLAFDGVNDHCTFTTAASVNLGADAYSFECALLLSTLPASGLYGIIGRNGTATGFAVTSDGRLAMYGAGILRYQTSAGLFLADSAQHVYRLEHDAGGAWRVYRDNLTTPIESGTYTTSTSAAGMNRIGTSTGGAGWLLGELAYVDLQIPVGSQRWDANLSGGTGSALPTVSGTNQGTLVNFTVPDCWVFYSTGATYTLTANGGSWSYSGGDTTLSFNRKLIAEGASWSYQGASTQLAYNRVLSADGVSYTYAGGEATLIYTTAGATYTLTADGGLWTCAGGNASLAYNRVMQAEGGAYQYSGGFASLLFNRVLTASGGSWSYALSDANLRMNRVLVASGVAYAYSGGSASLTYSGSVILQINGYTVGYGNSAMSAAFGASPVAATYGDNLVRAEYGNV